MATELIVAFISGVLALIAAGLAVWGQFRSAHLAAELEKIREIERARIESEKAIARYREPLAKAAYDFQSRLYNILKQNLIALFVDRGDERERCYVVDNTAFLVAQYLGWTEIIRRDIQFINLGKDELTRQLAYLQDTIYSLLQTDKYEKVFRIFAGEQRAIGERMIQDNSRGPECQGYATFLDQLSGAPDPLLEHIRQDVRNLTAQLPAARPRLVVLQNALIDLLDFLDPDYVRFPKARRTKVLK